MSWVPTNDFEEEIVSLQPDYNFIFGNYVTAQPEPFYPRPSAHLQFAAAQKSKKQRQQEGGDGKTNGHNQKLNIIAKVQRIAGTKPLGEQPTIEDWDTTEDVERETVAMMRHCGLGPSIEQALDERCTIATLPITEDVRIMHNGPKRIPIFFDEKFFKLRPRISNSSSGVESAETTPNGSGVANNSMFSATSGSSGGGSGTGTGSGSGSRTTEVNFNNDDENLSTERGATVLPKRDSAMNYEKLQNVVDFSSDTSLFESAGEIEDSYTTAYTSKPFISSQTWYSSSSGSHKSSGARGSKKSGRSGKAKNWRTDNSRQLDNSSSSDFPPLSSSSRHQQPQRFFTARELYERKRHE